MRPLAEVNSSTLENDTYTITSLEGNSKTFKLPEANDKYAIKENGVSG